MTAPTGRQQMPLRIIMAEASLPLHLQVGFHALYYEKPTGMQLLGSSFSDASGQQLTAYSKQMMSCVSRCYEPSSAGELLAVAGIR